MWTLCKELKGTQSLNERDSFTRGEIGLIERPSSDLHEAPAVSIVRRATAQCC